MRNVGWGTQLIITKLQIVLASFMQFENTYNIFTNCTVVHPAVHLITNLIPGQMFVSSNYLPFDDASCDMLGTITPSYTGQQITRKDNIMKKKTSTDLNQRR